MWLEAGLLAGGSAGLAPGPGSRVLHCSLPLRQAMNTLHKLQYAPEFKRTVLEAYPQLLLALLSQVHYVLELHLPTEPQPDQQAQETVAPSPQR